jgi:methionine synthase II (cobalamin-independent)
MKTFVHQSRVAHAIISIIFLNSSTSGASLRSIPGQKLLRSFNDLMRNLIQFVPVAQCTIIDIDVPIIQLRQIMKLSQTLSTSLAWIQEAFNEKNDEKCCE